MRSVCVAGAAMTAFGKYPDRGVRSLAEEAVTGALADAGAGIADVGMVFFGNAASGLVTRQECVRGQVALRRLGLAGTPVVNVENACASGSTEPSHVLAAMGLGPERIAGSIRFSLGWATTAEEIEEALRRIPPVIERVRLAKKAA